MSSTNEKVPYRLKNRDTGPVGIHAPLSPKSMFLFGLPFVAFGLYFTLGSLGIVELNASKVNGPMWLLTAAGLVFLMAGLIIWKMGYKQARLLATCRKLAQRHPDNPAMADYPWDRQGFCPTRWRPVQTSLAAFVFITIFASIPNCILHEDDSAPWLLRLSAIVMNLIVIASFVITVKKLRHALKFAKTQLIYPRFPMHLGESVQLKVRLPASVRSPSSAKFYLRCIKEYYVTSGSGKNRSKRLVHEVLYEAQEQADRTQLQASPGYACAQFELPESAPATHIQGAPPHFWELEMILYVPGLDLNQQYLLPIYRDESTKKGRVSRHALLKMFMK